MKKLIALTVVLLFSLTACARIAPPAETDSVPSDGHYPITVTDHAGREVVIESEPQKLVSCYYITTSLLMALGLEDRMVGIENDPDLRPVYSLSTPELLELPWVGTAKELDIEACIALDPDLVILPLRLESSAETLSELGIDVLLVNPESSSQLTEMIDMTAAAANAEARAGKLKDFIAEQKDYLEKSLAGADKPRVYLSGNSNFLSTAGSAMYQSEMIRLAGGENVADAIGDTYWATIDYEQLLAWDPDYIVLASAAKYSVEDVLADPNLSACTAVKEGNVYQIPSDTEAWDSPVPGSVLGSLWLAGILHPESVSADDFAARMDEFYEAFYDFAPSEQ